MTKRLSRKRSFDAIDQQGSVKKQKTQRSERYSNASANHLDYSTRDISWEEQKSLGGEFAQAGENCWPALKILEEGIKGRGKRYLVAWKPHPRTGEEFAPIWRSPADVGDDLIASWNHTKLHGASYRDNQQDKPTVRPSRNPRILPDSSDPPADDLEVQSNAPHTPPSLLSGSSVSGIEISETQDYTVNESPRVNIPPLPTDKHDYETIGSSQYSPSTALFEQPSLDVHFEIPSSRNNETASVADQPTPPRPTRRKSPLAKSPVPATFESSPQAPTSTTSKRKSKLSRVILPPQDNEIDSRSSTQASNLVTQVPIAISPVSSTTGLSHFASSARRSFRLSSPFQEGTSVQASSSPVASTRASQRLSASRRIGDSARLRKRVKTNLEAWATNFKMPDQEHIEVAQHIPSTILDQPSVHSANYDNITMASSGVNMANLDSVKESEFIPKEDDAFRISSSTTNTSDTNAMTLTIHESIEDEPLSSADNSLLMNSKANSSQESLNNMREVETVDGIMIPVRPLFGPTEYAIPLPAEGKVKSQYDEIIKIQKKAVIRFISRTGSPGTSDISSKKTSERNAMQDLLQQLNNTVTHTDLGLPMHTQYSLNPEAHAAYAEYAGSKFELLGYLVDNLKDKNCSIALFAQSGPLEDLLEEYLAMKQVPTRRHDRDDSHVDNYSGVEGLHIDLLPTQASKVVSLDQKPLFMIAFDVTFSTSDPQVKSLQEVWGASLPIIHFLVTNSSEHVERCVPDTLTSNIRLKVVVRTTYLASRNLGGDITYVPEESDQPASGRVMDMSEFQRAVRKSPARRLFLIADVLATLAPSGELAAGWPLGDMPELKLNDLELLPKPSRAASRTPQPRGTRNATPISRAATPIGKKRLLDIDGDTEHKRLRLTPVRDVGPENGSSSTTSDEFSEAKARIATLSVEVSNAKVALTVAEQKEAAASAKAQEWQNSHTELMHRFEKDRLKLRSVQKENKLLNASTWSYRERDETLRREKATLRQQLIDVRAELLQARTELTSGGGDKAELEQAREEVRSATSKMQALEKSLTSVKADFEFTRAQYQDASKLATDRTMEVKTLEDEVEKLKLAADDNKRSLKAMNYQTSLSIAMSRAEQFRLEVKNRDAVIKRLTEENATLKNRRGVQTRGSSIQPASSPGPRSRQASPAASHLMPPSGSRASVLRNEGR